MLCGRQFQGSSSWMRSAESSGSPGQSRLPPPHNRIAGYLVRGLDLADRITEGIVTRRAETRDPGFGISAGLGSESAAED